MHFSFVINGLEQAFSQDVIHRGFWLLIVGIGVEETGDL